MCGRAGKTGLGGRMERGRDKKGETGMEKNEQRSKSR